MEEASTVAQITSSQDLSSHKAWQQQWLGTNDKTNKITLLYSNPDISSIVMLQNKFDGFADFTTSTPSPSVQNSGLVDIKPKPGLTRAQDVDDESLSDVVAALVAAILALTFLLLLFCIIRVIQKRRRQLQQLLGQRMNQPIIQTISPGVFSASTAAYSQHIPTSGGISWERVDIQRRRELSPHLRNYYRLNSAHQSDESHDYQIPGCSRDSAPAQPCQQSPDLQFQGVTWTSSSSSPLTESETVQAGKPHSTACELQQLSAMPAMLSSLQMVQVDAVLHHAPSSEVQGAIGPCETESHVPSCSNSPLPSLPPPLFGSSHPNEWKWAPEYEAMCASSELYGAPGEPVRSVRAIGHQHKPSQ